MNSCKKFAKTLENLPFIAKLILVLLGDLYTNLIRLFRSLGKKNVFGVILALILIFSFGLVILWIIDLICVLFNKKIWWID